MRIMLLTHRWPNSSQATKHSRAEESSPSPATLNCMHLSFNQRAHPENNAMCSCTKKIPICAHIKYKLHIVRGPSKTRPGSQCYCRLMMETMERMSDARSNISTPSPTQIYYSHPGSFAPDDPNRLTVYPYGRFCWRPIHFHDNDLNG